ncbi:hypothetical protein DUNSADRAFT_16166 [Dunaliella salina]|uniref:Uncharacterized protein n=1 Tax=Dunaliella salina TaxID=3046 RepID=A0ABQ7G453_DUNSA|nr:hypothetical protein DUNSADRAFT_16166 [Dunaliella salina]|eukprot:KAF5829381.1 hypothetical protein DUNSADRAFT_16166 [Dunaliella salina]
MTVKLQSSWSTDAILEGLHENTPPYPVLHPSSLVRCPDFHHYHLDPSIALRLICSLIHDFEASSLRTCVMNKRGSLLPQTESPESAALCIGINSRELARALRYQLLYFATHFGGCSSKVQGELLACLQVTGGLSTVWQMGLRMVGRVADIQRVRQQGKGEERRAFQLEGGEGIDVEALEWWYVTALCCFYDLAIQAAHVFWPGLN